MKIEKKDIPLLLGVAGLLIAFLVFRFIFQPLSDKTTQLEAENQTLQTQINELRTVQAQLDFYNAETDRMSSEITDIMDQMPADQRPEDGVVLAYKAETASQYLYVTAMNFAEPVTIYTTGVGAVAADGSATAADTAAVTSAVSSIVPTATVPSYSLCNTEFGYNMNVSYQGLKDFVDYVYNQNDRKSISSVSVSFDPNTGLLGGSMTVDAYYVQGTDKTYVPPVVPMLATGTANPFGTVETGLPVQSTENTLTEEDIEDTEETVTVQ